MKSVKSLALLASVIGMPLGISAQNIGESLTVSGNLHSNYFYSVSDPDSRTMKNRLFDNKSGDINFAVAQLSLGYAKESTKAVLDLNFGPYANAVNLNTLGGQNDIVQNAYLVQSVNDKLSFEVGKFGTHIGYEVIDVTLNPLYSVSYLFYYGPFTHVGARVRYALNEKYGLMGGIYNNWDNLVDDNDSKTYAAALSFAPSEKLSGYLNWIGGKEGASDDFRSLFDLVANYTVSEKLGVGLNAIFGTEADSWYGAAVYLKYAASEKLAAAARIEHFSDADNARGFGTKVTAVTLGAAYSMGAGVAIRPEFKIDLADTEIFEKKDAGSSKSQTSIGLAVSVKF